MELLCALIWRCSEFVIMGVLFVNLLLWEQNESTARFLAASPGLYKPAFEFSPFRNFSSKSQCFLNPLQAIIDSFNL